MQNSFVMRSRSDINVTLLDKARCAVDCNARCQRYKLYKRRKLTQLMVFFTQNANILKTLIWRVNDYDSTSDDVSSYCPAAER